MGVLSRMLQAMEWAQADAYNATLALMVGVFALVFVASTWNDNYSWVDRSWSIVPVLYTWIIVLFKVREGAGGGGGGGVGALLDTPPVLFLAAVTLWGIRLTYNFYRRGGYRRGGEDYRWNHVRTWPLMGNPVVWTLFNLCVISFFQTWLLWAITLPMLSLPLEAASALDHLYVGVFLALLFWETVCDNQQWRFHQQKAASREGVLKYGFCVTGTFGFSRHLNVFCEGSMWVTLATAAWCRRGSPMPLWQWAGSVALVVLVHFSTGVITERLTKRKYPLYAVYQRTTPMLFPAFTSTTDRAVHLLEQELKAKRTRQR